MAAEVLVQWQAAEEAVRQQEARWPALQELMIHIALTREQLQVGARISTSAATAAITAWQAAHQAASGAAGDAAEFAAAETAAASAGLLLLLQLWHLLLRAQQAPPS